MQKSSEKMRVGLVFDDSLDRPDGVAQYVKTLGAWLSDQGHQVSYLVGETKLDQWAGGKVYSLSKNKTVSFNGNKLSMPLPGSTKNIKKFMKSSSFDVLHVMVPYSPFMAAKVIKYASSNTAVVGTFHIFPSGKVSRLGSILLRLILAPTLKRFKKIVSVSSAAADFAKTAYHLSSEVVPNPIQIKFFNSKKAKPHENEIVFLGRLVKRKGANQLIDAFGLLASTRPNAKLVIAGDGSQRADLEAKVLKMGLQSKVNFLGYIDEIDKPAVLGSATIACFPSLYGESFGIVLIEAMAAGSQVVIAGDNPGYSSVLGLKPELLINPNDTTAFAAKLVEFLDDKPKRQAITGWQHSYVKNFDISVVGQQIVLMYKTAIAR